MKAWDPASYDSRHHYVTDYGSSLVQVLSPAAGERILDLGCGTGHLTHEMAASGARVLGIDSSPEMIAHARRNYPEIAFELAGAAEFRAETPFDAVFSNAALHWMKPPEDVVRAIAGALRPGGRFVAEFGGQGNIRSIVGAVGKHPWYFPSIGEYSGLLEAHGLEVTNAALFPRPTPVEGETGLRDWIAMFCSSFVSPERVPAIEDALRGRLYREGIWYIDYVRLRICAVKAAA